jgi:hypothetical protein
MPSACVWCKNQAVRFRCQCGILFCSMECYNQIKDVHSPNCVTAVAHITRVEVVPVVNSRESMTIDEDRLLVPLDATMHDFIRCPICLEVPASGHLMEHNICDVTFCRSCLVEMKKQMNPNPPCPNCQKTLTASSTREANRYVRMDGCVINFYFAF